MTGRAPRGAGRPGRALRAACGALCALGLATAARGGVVPHPGGVDLVDALERAPLAIVGVVGQPRPLDPRGFTAVLRVQRVLSGSVAAGDALRIAWEEIAPEQPIRFRNGDRILVALEPAPRTTLWARRFPEPGQLDAVWAVASRGGAFLREPGRAGEEALAAWLALERSRREDPEGVARLVDLVRAGEVPLARSAIGRLGRVPALDERLGPPAVQGLVRALLAAGAAGEIGPALLDLVERRRLESLRPPLEALASGEGPATGEGLAPPVVFEALARLDGGIDAERARALLARGGLEHRLAVAHHASGPSGPALLEDLVRSDPTSEVRAAAVERIVRIEGPRAVGPAVGALRDTHPQVRLSAARALASLGPAAVPALRRLLEDGAPQPAHAAAILALARCGAPEGRSALADVAASHPDASVRHLADLALGRGLERAH